MNGPVRSLREKDPGCQVIITSHDPRYEVPGAVRYEPKHNVLKSIVLQSELIEDNICFLYGDTYYSEAWPHGDHCRREGGRPSVLWK